MQELRIYMYDRANLNALREELYTLLMIDDAESPGDNVEQLLSKSIPHKLAKKRGEAAYHG